LTKSRSTYEDRIRACKT